MATKRRTIAAVKEILARLDDYMDAREHGSYHHLTIKEKRQRLARMLVEALMIGQERRS